MAQGPLLRGMELMEEFPVGTRVRATTGRIRNHERVRAGALGIVRGYASEGRNGELAVEWEEGSGVELEGMMGNGLHNLNGMIERSLGTWTYSCDVQRMDQQDQGEQIAAVPMATRPLRIEDCRVGLRVRTSGLRAMGTNLNSLRTPGLEGTIAMVVPEDGGGYEGPPHRLDAAYPGGDVLVNFGPEGPGWHPVGEDYPDIDDRDRVLYFWLEELENMEGGTMAITAAPAPRPRPATSTRMRVEITKGPEAFRGATRTWMAKVTNGPDPQRCTGVELRTHIPKEWHRAIANRYWEGQNAAALVHRLMEAGVPPEVVLAGVQGVCLAKQAREQTGVFSLEQQVADPEFMEELLAQPPMILIGDKLFSLQAQGAIAAGRGLAVMRKRVMDKAKGSIEKLMTNARSEAKVIVLAAERKQGELMAGVESKMQELGRLQAMRLPEWVMDQRYGYALMPMIGDESYPWRLLLRGVSLRLERVTWMADPERRGASGRFYIWKAQTDKYQDETIDLWLPVNFATEGFKYDGTSYGCSIPQWHRWSLPHIDHQGCCMKLQGMPEKLRGHQDLAKVVEVLSRGMLEINLNSLLDSNMANYPKGLKDQLPQIVKEKYINCNVGHQAMLAGADEQQGGAQVAQEMFTPEIVEQALRATGATAAIGATVAPETPARRREL